MSFARHIGETLFHYGTYRTEFLRRLAIRVYAGTNLRFRYLRRTIKALNPHLKVILDVACGFGDHLVYFARKYPGASFHGVDIDAECTKAVEQRLTLL